MSRKANIVDCEYCGKAFNKKPFRCKRDNLHFCSSICVYNWKKDNPMSDTTRQKIREKALIRAKNNPQLKGINNPRFSRKLVKCKYCNKDIFVTNIDNIRYSIHFCNRECYDKYRTEKKYINLNCSFCGKEIVIQYNRLKNRKNHYCSEKCRASHFSELFSGENAPRWKGGISFEYYPVEFNSKIKNEIRERDNKECKLCFLTELQALELYSNNLHVHHIDYNKQNNDEGNLITLCSACHAKTNANRKKWEKYFKNRMEELLCL